jgi:FlaG/FlaF family flagellin (archaellin)
MNRHDTSFAAFATTAHPWSGLRRRNLISRTLYALGMMALGVAAIAGVVLLVVFAASVALAAAVAVAAFGLYAALTRKPAHVRVRADDQSNGKGVYIARKSGSTWTVY